MCFCHFTFGVLGKVRYLIVSIPDTCLLFFFAMNISNEIDDIVGHAFLEVLRTYQVISLKGGCRFRRGGVMFMLQTS